jgi:hypothetical protein
VPEGDTLAWAANRIRPALEGRVPEAIETPHPRHARERWPERLAGRVVTSVDTHGKHLFLRFEGGLVLHSHLGMTGAWDMYGHGRPWRRPRSHAWLVLRSAGHEVIEFDGPLLELLTEGRTVRHRAVPAIAASRRSHPPNRRCAARSADGSRDRQPVEGRRVLGSGGRPLAARGESVRRRGSGDHRWSPSPNAPLRGRGTAPGQAKRLPARRSSVSSLRNRDRRARTG